MPRLLQRIQVRREERKARRVARLADDYVRDADKIAAEARYRRVKADSPPYGGGDGA